MLKQIILFTLAAVFILSCNHKHPRPTTSIDTGRDFIRATLDGNFDEAQSLLYNDSTSTNMQLFKRYTEMYDRLPDADKKGYKDADYIINKVTDQGDSVSIINYSNTYMKKEQDIKLVRKDSLWQIDFQYTFAANN
jgi:hypothetical protein